MSIRGKVISCFLVILSLFGGASLYNFVRSSHSNGRLIMVNELFLPLSRYVVQIQSNTTKLAEDFRRYFFRREISPEDSTFSRMARDLYPYIVNKKFDVVRDLLQRFSGSEERQMVSNLTLMLQQAEDHFKKMSHSADNATLEKEYALLAAALKSLSLYLDEECQRIIKAVQREVSENLIYGLILSLIAAMFGLFTMLMSHKMLAPLPQLIESVKKGADGDFNQSLKVRASHKDEFAVLAKEYNRMLGALAERDNKIHNQQKELLDSERLAAIGKLSAEVVHEIRNPLNSISLNIDWLESELENCDSEIVKTLKSISKEIERLNLITESYLVRARMPSGENRKTSFHNLIDEVIDFSREELKQRKIDVEKEFVGDEVLVDGDRSKLKQAFLNVLRNAKDAMPNGGKILIKSILKENVFEVCVSDTGYGMNEATKRNFFKPFFTTKPNGTGLGMMLTRKIVEEARGAISCESKLGQGTVVTFQFPA